MEKRFAWQDDSFLAQLTQLYRERIPANGTVLDLMSSWVSHLPNDAAYAKVGTAPCSNRVCQLNN